jgi:hypothetical protein
MQRFASEALDVPSLRGYLIPPFAQAPIAVDVEFVE